MELGVFFRERSPKNMEDMVKFGEHYIEAHGGEIGKSKVVKNKVVRSEDRRSNYPYTPPVVVRKHFVHRKILEEAGCILVVWVVGVDPICNKIALIEAQEDQ